MAFVNIPVCPLNASDLPDRPAASTLAAARHAVGEELAWHSIKRLQIRGIYDAGNEPGTFRQTVDFRSGYYRTDVSTGAVIGQDGFDGGSWTSQNGIVARIDLPELIADARSRAFVLREGWRDGAALGRVATDRSCDRKIATCIAFAVPHGSPVTIWFDRASHLPLKAVIDTDDGEETTTFDDWRKVGPIRIAFRRTINDTAGATTTLTVKNAVIRNVETQPLVRPAARSRGKLAAGSAATTRFEFTAFDRGHVVVPAMINGRPARLLFDSGGANYFTPETARELGLHIAGGVNIGGVGAGTERGGFASITDMAIGGATLAGESAIVGPLPYPALHPRAGMSIAGLTGYEFLSEFRTTIDYAAQTLSFAHFDAPVKAGGVTVPFFSDGHSIYVTASIESVPGIFRLDTGDGGSLTVFRRFADQHRLFQTGGHQALQAGGVGGAIPARELMTDSFVLAGSVLRNVPISISDTSAGAFFSRSLAGNLGAAILARFTITFDYQARTLTFTPNTDIAKPFTRDCSGLSVTQRGPTSLDVLSVIPESSADKAGVSAGDKIIEIDAAAVDANNLGLFDLAPLRFGSRSFSLLLDRAGKKFFATITPLCIKSD